MTVYSDNVLVNLAGTPAGGWYYAHADLVVVERAKATAAA